MHTLITRGLGRHLPGLALAALTAGCTGSSDLRQTNIPPDFTFRASRASNLTVVADDALFGDAPDAQIVVTRVGGAAVYRGPIRRGERTQIGYRASLADTEVDVTVLGRGGERTRRFRVNGAENTIGRIE